MKRVFLLLLAILLATSLTAPGWAGPAAPKGDSSSGHAKKWYQWRPHLRSNKGGKKAGEVTGKERAEEVQEMKKRPASKHGTDVAPGVEKAETHTNKTGKGKK